VPSGLWTMGGRLSKASLASLRMASCVPLCPADGPHPRTNEQAAASTSRCMSCLFNRSTSGHPCHHLAPCPAADEDPMPPMSPSHSLQSAVGLAFSPPLRERDVPSGRLSVDWHQ
jgi:hypothetical protein